MIAFIDRFSALPALLWRRQSPSPLHGSSLIQVNQSLARELGLAPEQAADELLQWLSCREPSEHGKTLAMKYGGHQFGQWNPQLGDGRGLLLGSLLNQQGDYLDVHLKGSGPTPFSRQGDGRAVLRSSIREYLASEALHALGVASTRALALARSSHPVQRERLETAATLLRVAKTHIRFGHFEWLFYSGEQHALQSLADHVIDHLYPEAKTADQPYAVMFERIVQRTAEMIAHWQAIGFTHGVMNTDNMSVAGETFDFGPYGFLESYNPFHIPNTSDVNGRYAWYQQPTIGLWNLNALGHALSGLLTVPQIKSALSGYEPALVARYDELMASKLGLPEQNTLHPLLDAWLQLLRDSQCDYHLAFRWLANDINSLDLRFWGDHQQAAEAWLKQYRRALSSAPDEPARQQRIRQHNPVTVLRNAFAQEAIAASEQGDDSVFRLLLDALTHPFELRAEWARFSQPHENQSICGPLSCSS